MSKTTWIVIPFGDPEASDAEVDEAVAIVRGLIGPVAHHVIESPNAERLAHAAFRDGHRWPNCPTCPELQR